MIYRWQRWDCLGLCPVVLGRKAACRAPTLCCVCYKFSSLPMAFIHHPWATSWQLWEPSSLLPLPSLSSLHVYNLISSLCKWSIWKEKAWFWIQFNCSLGWVALSNHLFPEIQTKKFYPLKRKNKIYFDLSMCRDDVIKWSAIYESFL